MMDQAPVSEPLVIEVAIPLRVEKTFHYRVPAHLAPQVCSGKRVLVPFGRRVLTGYVLGWLSEGEVSNLKEIRSLLDDEPLWTERELELYRWIGSYYLHPLGQVLKTVLPTGINPVVHTTPDGSGSVVTAGKKKRMEMFYQPVEQPGEMPRLGHKAREVLELIRVTGETGASELRRRFGACSSQVSRLCQHGLVTVAEREVFRDPFADCSCQPDTPRTLGRHQQAAVEALSRALDTGCFAPFLLQGVTGSGKTEVYLQAIGHALDQGKNALTLVPEIALTPQLVSRFRMRFGNEIAVLHSGLTDAERYDQWRRIRCRQVRIVIGARSALFAPVADLGIIIIDEEHESSFKQTDGLRYNARDLALVRGRLEQAVVVLGSATPQITSRYAAEQGRLRLLELPERIGGSVMPSVELVEQGKKGSVISPVLATALKENLQAGNQSLLFLNRRGFATFLLCSDCGVPLTCPNCSVTLTYHRQRGESVCHHCGYAVPSPGTCPGCGGRELKELGAGTERLEDELRELLPTARILRMDGDTTTGRGSHEHLFKRMTEGNADILVGTQMVAKGHDFPGVTLVGIINGDASLNIPDFRSAERTFQILSQVIGRAGRGSAPGRVIVQATMAHHYAIQCAIAHDSSEFYRQELSFRREIGYPPFVHLAALEFSGTGEQSVEERARIVFDQLVVLKRELEVRVELLGPSPAPLYRLRGRFRRQILLKAQVRQDLRRLVGTWMVRRQLQNNVRESVDMDPVDMM